MTPSAPHPDERWLELLAAYVDDELDEPTRERVERWLAAHPEAKAELRGQKQFSPNNWRLWQKLEPPLPDDDAWAGVRDAVAARADRKAEPAPAPARGYGWKWVAGGLAAAVTAAAIVLSAGTSQKSPTPAVRQTTPADDDPHGGVAVLPITTPGDVVFFRVPGNAASRLPVGATLTPGMLALASADDVRIEEAEPSATWPTKMTPGPGDMPMIFASKP
jgi:anti-sigma factor RsiW